MLSSLMVIARRPHLAMAAAVTLSSWPCKHKHVNLSCANMFGHLQDMQRQMQKGPYNELNRCAPASSMLVP